MFWLLLACTGEISGTTQGGEDSGSADSASNTDDTGAGVQTDLRQAGPYAVNSEALTWSLSCEAETTRHWPAGVSEPPVVLLSHGFARSKENMAEIAEHLASWGLEVYTPDLCAFSDHAANGADLAAAAATLGRPVVYMGYSAGGLASVLAGAQDSSAVGVVGLDPVDNDGAGAAAGLTLPSLGLFGEPRACNAESNGLAMFPRQLIATGADHCDFEGPTDGVCEVFCDGAEASDDPERRAAIRALATAAGLGLHGDDALLAAWWSPEGEWGSQLVAAGLLRAAP